MKQYRRAVSILLSIEMEAGDGIGLRLSRLQGKNSTFYRVIKATPRVSKTTPKPQSGVRFGVRSKPREHSRKSVKKVVDAGFYPRRKPAHQNALHLTEQCSLWATHGIQKRY